MANPLTVHNTDILTTQSTASIQYTGISGVDVDNEEYTIGLTEDIIDAVNNIQDKLDTTAFEEVSGDFMQTPLLESADGHITAYSGIPFSAGVNYTEGDYIQISGTEISVTGLQPQLSNEQLSAISSVSSLDQQFYPLNSNPSGYLTEHQSLDNYYTKNETSSKDEISDALSTKQDNLSNEQLSAISSVSSLGDVFYPLNENPSGYLTNSDISDLATKDEVNYVSGIVDSNSSVFSGSIDYLSGAITAKQDQLTNEQLSAISSVSSLDGKYYPLESNPSGYLTNSDISDLATKGEVNYVSGVVDSVSSNLSGAIDYVSGNVGKTYNGISPISVDNVNNEISLTQTLLSANSPLTITETAYNSSAVTLLEVNTDNLITFDTFTAYTANADTIEYSGVSPNIYVSDHRISGRDWGDAISAASSHAYSQATAQIPDISDCMSSTLIGSANNQITAYDGVPFAGASTEPSANISAGEGIGIQVNTDDPSNPKVIISANVTNDTLTSYALKTDITACMSSTLLGTENNYITSYNGMEFKGQGGGESVPWISAWKDLDNTVQMSWGDTFYCLSSIDVSGYKNHAVGVKGAALVLPTTGGLMATSLIGSANNTITSYDGVPFAGGGGGSNYTGVSPIVVDNATQRISVDNVPFGVQSPLFVAQDNGNGYIIGCSASGNMHTSGFDYYNNRIAGYNGSSFYYETVPTGILAESSFNYTTGGEISGYNNSAFVGGDSFSGLFQAQYGLTTYADIKDAVDNHKTVYCHHAGRMASLSYSASNYYEFLWYFSRPEHYNNQQGDQVFVYRITNDSTTGSWSDSSRETYSRISAGSGLSGSYANNTFTLGVDSDMYQNKLTFEYDANDAISSINNSAISDSRQGTDLYVQSPLFTGTSGTSAYIGWNNETVLFSGSSNTDIELSDSLNNYENVKIYWTDWNSNSCTHINEFPTDSNTNYELFGCWPGGGDGVVLFDISLTANANKDTLTVTQKKFINLTGSTVSTANLSYIKKVVGINRKS